MDNACDVLVQSYVCATVDSYSNKKYANSVDLLHERSFSRKVWSKFSRRTKGYPMWLPIVATLSRLLHIIHIHSLIVGRTHLRKDPPLLSRNQWSTKKCPNHYWNAFHPLNKHTVGILRSIMLMVLTFSLPVRVLPRQQRLCIAGGCVLGRFCDYISRLLSHIKVKLAVMAWSGEGHCAEGDRGEHSLCVDCNKSIYIVLISWCDLWTIDFPHWKCELGI